MDKYYYIIKDFKSSEAFKFINAELDRKADSVLKDLINEKEERREFKAGYLSGLKQFSILINRIITNGEFENMKEV